MALDDFIFNDGFSQINICGIFLVLMKYWVKMKILTFKNNHSEFVYNKDIL